MAFMKQLHHQMAQENRQQKMVQSVIIPPENICWMLTLR